MQTHPILGDQAQSSVQRVGVIPYEWNSHFAESCGAHTSDLDHVYGLETHVELGCNLVAFREARLPVYLLIVWYLGEV